LSVAAYKALTDPTILATADNTQHNSSGKGTQHLTLNTIIWQEHTTLNT